MEGCLFAVVVPCDGGPWPGRCWRFEGGGVDTNQDKGGGRGKAAYIVASLCLSSLRHRTPMPSAPTYDYIVEQPVKRAPPCCKISFCRNACEYSKPCVKCGGCGAMPQTSRKGAMGCTLCLAVIALILSIFPILGLSKSAGLIKAFPWATADPSYSNLLLLQYQSDPSEKVWIPIPCPFLA